MGKPKKFPRFFVLTNKSMRLRNRYLSTQTVLYSYKATPTQPHQNLSSFADPSTSCSVFGKFDRILFDRIQSPR
jgi:hypothetical protein